MTQLFDTTTYDHDDDRPGRRHLRSIRAAGDPSVEAGRHDNQWRLDHHTIEIGRKGIEAARQALRQASAHSPTKNGRRAA